MKDKRPIQQQVAELTEEQKDNIVSAFKKSLWSMIPLYVLFICAVILVNVWSGQATEAYWAASDRQYEVRDMYADIVQIDGETLTLWNLDHPKVIEADSLAEAAEQKADALKAARIYVLIVGAVVLVGGNVILNLMVAKKYPYYTEKRYYCIKKQRKEHS